MTEVFTLDRQIEFAESKSVTKTLHFDLQFPMYRTIAASLRRLRELEQSDDFDESRAEECRQCIELHKALKECESELRAVKLHYGDRR